MTDSSDTFGHPPDFQQLLPEFQRLCEVVATLRSPDGCPWDRQQTLKTIKPYTLEETYELLEAIDTDDNAAIQEELGDVLLQVILDAQIATDENRFHLIDVVRQIADKMIQRHPHVFGDAKATTTAEVKEHWKSAKAQDKLNEELQELAAELFEAGHVPQVAADVNGEVIPDEPIPCPDRRARAKSELGDVLFVLANVARRWGINPEEALRESNAKFSRRFQAIEAAMKQASVSMDDATLQQMEQAYQDAKRQES
jgi:tetrapyrrole methylase family protein/MazG family protein